VIVKIEAQVLHWHETSDAVRDQRRLRRPSSAGETILR
jgi:hypothetical protein